MDVILLTKVANLGNIGDRVKVKSGYGRNFLLPKGKATLATPDNVKKFEARRAELEKVAREQFQDAESRSAALQGLQAADHRQGRHRRQAVRFDRHRRYRRGLHQPGHKLARAEVRLPTGPLRTVGDHMITLHLHTDIDVQLPVVITAEE